MVPATKPTKDRDGLIRCPRSDCRRRWPDLFPIHDQSGAVDEWACEACIFEDWHDGKVTLTRTAVGK
jgi:hypothetical protein